MIRINNFPINTLETGSIILEKTTPAVDANTKWYASTKEGIKQMSGPALITYKGKIENNDASNIFLTYSEGTLTGYIDAGNGFKYDVTTGIDTYNNLNKTIIVSEHNVAIRQDPTIKPFTCLTDDSDLPGNEKFNDLKIKKDDNIILNSSLLECKIAIECASNVYRKIGSNYNVAAIYIASVMSQVSFLYEETINVHISLPYVMIYQDANNDPYDALPDITDKLSAMPIYNNGQQDGAALQCLFTDLSAQTNTTAGLSFGGSPDGRGVGTLCDKQRGYSVFGVTCQGHYPNYNYTWDVDCAAHEIGHNFGSPHTHNCCYEPALDSCVTKTAPQGGIGDACTSGQPVPRPGTIMSYCHLTNPTYSVQLIFHPKQINDMRRAAQGASCMGVIGTPTINILGPLVNNAFVPDQNIPIRWTSALVNYLDIKYSLDNGTNWTVLATNVKATDSIYNWKAPNVNTTQGLIIVSSASNSSIADTTKVNFSITVPEIHFVSPTRSLKYSNLEKMDISWSSNLIKNFNIYFSNDGGTTLTTIATNFGNTNSTIDIPDITSANCIIRVTDANNVNLKADSPVFSVGRATAMITSPVEGNVLCAGRSFTITWTSDNVHNVMVSTSTNNGALWTKIRFAAIEADSGQIHWTPTVNTDSALIKISLFIAQDTILAQTAPFKVVTCGTGVDDENSSSSYNGITILSVSPNPVSSIASIKYQSANEKSSGLEFYISDIRGAMVTDPISLSSVSGENTFDYDMTNLNPGTYFLCIKSGDGAACYKFTVIK
jgi:hypothetical protein